MPADLQQGSPSDSECRMLVVLRVRFFSFNIIPVDRYLLIALDLSDYSGCVGFCFSERLRNHGMGSVGRGLKGHPIPTPPDISRDMFI